MEPEAPFRGQVFTVTAITLAVKQTLEGVFRDIFVEGEISNLREAASGHVQVGRTQIYGRTARRLAGARMGQPFLLCQTGALPNCCKNRGSVSQGKPLFRI